MEYLTNQFNHSINHYNDGIYGLLKLELFYYIVLRIICRLKDLQPCKSMLEDEYDINEIIPYNICDDVFNDKTIDDNVKLDLINLLDINSLDRHYILYYIFKIKGLFYDGCLNINTYTYYETIVSIWKNTHNLLMNLDERLHDDYQIIIDEIIYDCNHAHIRFLSWLYYSGIYNYLMNNQNIKKQVLHEMNSKRLLSGNVFLKYQIYLIESDEEETIKESDNAKAECDYEINYVDDNEEELNTRYISEDMSNMNEMTFAREIITHVLHNTYMIIKGKITKLFSNY